MALPPVRNISLYQGDRWTELYAFERNIGTAETPNMVPVDFTGHTPRAEIRYKATDASPVATFTCSFENNDPTSGQIRVTLPGSESVKVTKSALWDLETIDADGEPTTWLRGEVAVTLQITRVVPPS